MTSGVPSLRGETGGVRCDPVGSDGFDPRLSQGLSQASGVCGRSLICQDKPLSWDRVQTREVASAPRHTLPLVSRLLAAQRRAELERLQVQVLTDAITSASAGDLEKPGGFPLLRAPRSAAGDLARLRGVPMIGAGGGAIPGTRPGDGGHLARMDRATVSPRPSRRTEAPDGDHGQEGRVHRTE